MTSHAAQTTVDRSRILEIIVYQSYQQKRSLPHVRRPKLHPQQLFVHPSLGRTLSAVVEYCFPSCVTERPVFKTVFWIISPSNAHITFVNYCLLCLHSLFCRHFILGNFMFHTYVVFALVPGNKVPMGVELLSLDL